MISNKTGSSVWSDSYFNSFKGMFVYRGCQLERIVGGWKIFEQKVTTREEVDTIIDKACVSVKKSIKK